MTRTVKSGDLTTPSGNESGDDIRFAKLEELLTKATILARIGGWEVDAVKGTVYWSDITREIHEAAPGFHPSIEEAVNFYKEGENRETIVKNMEEAIKKGTPCDLELQIVTTKGNIKWVRVIVEAEFADGKCLRVYGSFQDIDARKKAEVAAKQALEERNTILESIGDAFFAVDKNWVVTYWNRMAEKVLGRPKNEILNHNLWEVYSDSIDSESYKKYHQALETNQAVHFADYYAPIDKWYEISAYPSDTGLSVYFKDVTERMNYIKAIEEQNKKLKEISWMQSHIIRAPLARIMGLVQIIKDTKRDTAEKKKTLDYLLSSANELDRVIREITDKTKAAYHSVKPRKK
ncbi:MAG TPA: PAS domain-containing protein [Mucilaginibacter sp.]|nr:PAS domain-containing protein [Mucilaginibacter sp.]